MFGTPKNDMKFFEADDLGITHDPFPNILPGLKIVSFILCTKQPLTALLAPTW